MNRLIATLMIVTVLCGAAAKADTMYVVTPLGTLGGPNSDPTAINSSGVVTGWADPDIGGTAYAFTWTAPGPIQSLGTLSGGIASAGNSINDSGWVAGASDTQAVVYTPQSGMQPLGFLRGGSLSQANCVNNAGVVVGDSGTVGETYLNPFLWTAAGGMQDLNSTITNMPSGWTPTAAGIINNSGLIAGIGYANLSTYPPSGTEHAFTLSGGSLTVMPNPYPTGFGIYPEGMNSSGEVVGLAVDANEQEHAFVYTPADGTRDLGNLGGDLAVAFGVNDLGTIVGGTELSDGTGVAFIYTNAGGMVNLNTLAPVNGWTLDCACGINDNGQIIAQGYNGNDYQAFLLTPTPEPSTFGLLIAFACFILILQLCHRRLVKH